MGSDLTFPLSPSHRAPSFREIESDPIYLPIYLPSAASGVEAQPTKQSLYKALHGEAVNPHPAQCCTKAYSEACPGL